MNTLDIRHKSNSKELVRQASSDDTSRNLGIFDKLDVKRRRLVASAGLWGDDQVMNGDTTVRRRYLELTALLIEREIARLRRGEQAALVSFHNVALLAGNAREELMAPGARRGTARSYLRRELYRRSA